MDIDETMLRRSYRQHCADVLKNCPKEKLVILEGPNCGWELMCKIVGVPIPENICWPHKNKKASILAEELQPGSRMSMAIKEEALNRLYRFGLAFLFLGFCKYTYVITYIVEKASVLWVMIQEVSNVW